MRYKRHKAKWSKCTKCELHQYRNRIVLARGKLPCDILFVGEAPGQSEDVIGKPFCGPAGKLMDYMLQQAIGDTDASYALTNLVACIPKGEDNRKLTEPSKECIKACRSRLNELIKMANADVVIAVGRLAEKHLTSISIPHPASLLRMDVSRKNLEIQRTITDIRDIHDEHVTPF
jgi:uracil-DNA glycosylase